VPVSRKRKKTVYTPPPTKADKKAANFDSPRWLPIVMVTLWVIGLLWIVVWYMVPNPVMDPLGSWNIAIGFAFIATGFFFATRWR
jgi:hypothetical protein